jgi:transcription antitermination factor NusG
MEMVGNLARAFEEAGLIDPSTPKLDFQEPRLWHVLMTQPQQERKAADWLRSAHHSVYFPNFVEQVKSRKGLRRSIIRPIVIGYLFLAVRPGTDLNRVVERIPGLVGYLRDEASHAAVIREREILKIRELEATHFVPETGKIAHAFKIGQRVRLVDDVYLGWRGPIIALAQDGRISVEVNLLGRKVPVWLVPSQIERM